MANDDTYIIETAAGSKAKAAAAVVAARTDAAARYLPKDVGPRRVMDIRDYVPNGVLPENGQAIVGLLQGVYDQASASYLSTGVPAVVALPSGGWRCEAQLGTRPGAGIVAPGSPRTAFFPEGNNSFMTGPLWNLSDPEALTTFYDDQLFAGFTVDGKNQLASAGYGGTKGFYYQNARRLRYHDVAMVNIWATAFGVDFISDGVATDCYVAYAGRGTAAGDETNIGPTNSGFAPGVGRFLNEGMTWQNCVAEYCRGGGWLFEQLGGARGGIYQPVNFRIVNSTSRYNKYGVVDIGAGGLTIDASLLAKNHHSGLFVGGPGGRAPGRNGRVSNTHFYQNGGGADAPFKGGNGVTFAYGDAPQGWEFTGDMFEGNAYAGILATAGLTPGKGGLRVNGGTFMGSQYGIRAEALYGVLRSLAVRGARFVDNTAVDIDLATEILAAQIFENSFEAGAPTGINLPAGATRTAAMIALNAFHGKATPIANMPTDREFIKDNLILAPA